MIRVLGLALYGSLAASTRYRLEQYVPGLAAHGIDLQVRRLLGDEYLGNRFRGRATSPATLVGYGWRRLADLHAQRDFDLSMLHCELFPFLPGWAETALLRRPFIYDFDDAFHLKYRLGRYLPLRPLLGGKFDRVMGRAAAVTAGNRRLAAYAELRNDKTRYLPTVVDSGRYLPMPRTANDAFTVGWIGSPSTSAYLKEIVEPLSLLGREGRVRFVVIGGAAPRIDGVEVVETRWDESTEIADINGFDVGVMPLPDDDWARGKCAFKLIQYMACAVPVVASAVGANMDVVDSNSGFLAATPTDWLEALRSLRDSAALRREMGDAARERIVRDYSLARTLPVLVETIRGIAGKEY